MSVGRQQDMQGRLGKVVQLILMSNVEVNQERNENLDVYVDHPKYLEAYPGAKDRARRHRNRGRVQDPAERDK